VHCARTDRYTLITCHRGRGQDGIDDAGVLARFRGVAVHDAWAPYDTYVNADHQLCCAHALRELQAVADTAAQADPDADWCWAIQAAEALVAMQKLVDDAVAAGVDTIDPDTLGQQVAFYHSAAQVGLTQTAARSTKLMKTHNALARRLLDRQDDYLRFTQDWRIPPDNDLVSHCTSWGRCAVSRLVAWSCCRGFRIVACASDISGSAGDAVGVAAA